MYSVRGIVAIAAERKVMVIEFLNSIRGDAPMYIQDGDPEQRKKVSAKIVEMVREGQAIFLIQGDETRRIQGYDDASNEWLVLSEPRERPKQTYQDPASAEVQSATTTVRRRGRPRKLDRVSAQDSRVTAVGRGAGG